MFVCLSVGQGGTGLYSLAMNIIAVRDYILQITRGFKKIHLHDARVIPTTTSNNRRGCNP